MLIRFIGILLGLFMISPSYAQQAGGSVTLALNGSPVSPEDLSSELFCIQAADTFTVTYIPEEGADSTQQLTFSRIDLLGQISLGRPQLMGSKIKVPGNPAPLSFTFTIRDLITNPMLLKGAGTSIRTSVELGPMLVVQGNRILKTLPLSPVFQRFSLVAVPGC
ncbi:MAG: hypothetical protein AAFV07_02140 [Bacteroidota bacterium]